MGASARSRSKPKTATPCTSTDAVASGPFAAICSARLRPTWRKAVSGCAADAIAASRNAPVGALSGGERTPALRTIALSRSRKGLAGFVHGFERALRDGAAVLDHVLEALADKTALGRRELLNRPAMGKLAQALEIALELPLSQAIQRWCINRLSY